MGLDMYLNAKRSLFSFYEDDDVKITHIAEKFPEFGEFPITSVSAEIAYWRKANQIHNWFVQHVQGGEDDCREYYVPPDTLETLLATVLTILEAPDRDSVAKELLPTRSGFFFGSTELDEYYYDDLVKTKAILEKILNSPEIINKCDIYYRASW